MMRARLIVDAKTLRGAGVGPATGVVWISLGEIAFPFEGWDDFVVVILDAWASALLNLLRGVSQHEEVHFMEGPYTVQVARLSESVFQLRAIERRRGERACVEADALALVESLLTGAESILTACRAAKIWSTDADRLSASLPLLRREAIKLESRRKEGA